MRFFLPVATLVCALSFASVALSAPDGGADQGVSNQGASETILPVHGLAMYGNPKYPPDFTHFDYVNPDAPKGGTLRLAAMGAFDTLNPYTIRGESAIGLALTYDTLMTRSADEPFTSYGLLAQSVEISPDRSWILFNLRPEAKWSDGEPITADDVAFSLETLRTKGLPFFNAYYRDVKSVEVLGPRKVRFTFNDGQNRELPMIVGDMPVLPKHYWKDRDFSAVTLDAPVSSGPYKIQSFEQGRSITYARRGDYWGNNLPVVSGMYNFDQVVYTSYRDSTVMLEAFKSGAYDFRQEIVARQWATGYDGPALRQGRIVREALPNHRTIGLQGMAYNTRRPVFSDLRVREALAYAFDFNWTNQALFYGLYKRTRSYFQNSELTSTGTPTPEERALLDPWKDKLDPRVFTDSYMPPDVSDATGGIRGNLTTALKLLGDACWHFRDGALRNEGGEAFQFEILLVQPEFERILLPFAKNLERLGIKATIRTVDTAQYINRVQKFDFDMAIDSWGQSDSPGNEQRDYWSSGAANAEGSRNSTGIQSPVVDDLVEKVISARSREDLVTRVHALDRVLQWSFLTIPQYHNPSDWVAYWNKFGHPETPSAGVQLMTWWVDPQKEAALKGSTDAR